MENQKKQPTNALAKKMGISLVCGIGTGMALLFLRESLNGSGKEAAWAFINNLLFQDITAQGAEKTLGVFYLIGQLFIRCLQLVIVPMVFTSITLAIGQISDTRTLGRISAKTIGWFLICSFFALVLGCGAGSMVYRAGFFHTQVEGLAGSAGSTGANPMNVILNVVPANIITAFGSNTAVLAVVFVAACLGLSMNALGEERTCTLRKLIQEVNDIVVVFLNYVVTKFGPFAIFVLLTRTFATYGIDYLKPAFAYVLAAVAMLLVSGVYAGREDTYRVYAVQEDGYASYLLRPGESETPAKPHRLEPGWVPEGWELDRISEGEEYFRTVFFLPVPEEPSFTLTQYYGKDDSSVLQGAFTIRECKVGGEHALLLAAENTGLRILLWCSGPYGFQLSSSALEEGDLLRIAENLKW